MKLIFQIRELLRERTKCRALAEELENPMNVHRWRKLEGSDPASYELIQKVQALQKRLIEKTEDIGTFSSFFLYFCYLSYLCKHIR